MLGIKTKASNILLGGQIIYMHFYVLIILLLLLMVAIDSSPEHEFTISTNLRKKSTRSHKRRLQQRRHHHSHGGHHHFHHRKRSFTEKNGSFVEKCNRRLVMFFSKMACAVIPNCARRTRAALTFRVVNKRLEYLENNHRPVQFDFDSGFILPQSLVVNRQLLPPLAAEKKRTIVLDMDETLIHASANPETKSYDFIVRPEIDGKIVPMHVRKRPGVDEFLNELSERFELVAFTAGLKPYAALVLDNLDPEGRIFAHRLYREACKEVYGRYVKDLSELGRDLRKVVIVDDNPKSYSLQPGNGIPIRPFSDDLEDRELEKLIEFFRRCGAFRDMREAVKQLLSREKAAGTDSDDSSPINFPNQH